MKKIHYISAFLFLIIILRSNTSSAQQYPLVRPAGKGILVYPGKEAPGSDFYKIERTQADQDNFATIAMLTSPRSNVEFRGLVNAYSPLFIFSKTFDSTTVINVWQEFKKNNPVNKYEGLINLPLMQAALGMVYYDTNVKAGISYRYKVSIISGGKEGKTSTSSAVSYPAKAGIENIRLYKSVSNENEILIYWFVTGKNKPFSFEVFRQEVSKRQYISIEAEKGFNNHEDTLFLIVKDRSVNKDENYNYYIIPFDQLGNQGDAGETVRISAASVNTLPVIANFMITSSAKKDGLVLKWKFDRIKHLRNLSIFRSDEFDGDYKKIAEVPSDDSTYTDRTVQQGKTYYYYLVINALNKQTYPSAKVAGFFTTDVKPMPPQMLKAEPLNSSYKLTWICIDDNIEGFLVYRCKGIKGKMIQISGIIKPGIVENVFTDSSAELNMDAYSYAVRTVSKSFIESNFSDTVAVVPTASKDAPITPTRVSARLYDNSVLVIWDNMYKLNPALAGYNIYRKEKNEKDYHLLNNELLRNSKNSYSDTAISGGQEFLYRVESIDIYSNKSGKSEPVRVAVNMPVSVSPAGVKLYNKEEGIIVVWDEVIQSGLVSYKIYRFGEKGDPVLIHTSKPDNRNYLDKEVKAGELYFYYINSVDEFGNESPQMNEVSIRR